MEITEEIHMKALGLIALHVIGVASIQAQVEGQKVKFETWPELISYQKTSSVPVVASDEIDGAVVKQYGTAVLMIAPSGDYLGVTCEHVVALKDQFERTVSYLPDISLRLNDIDVRAVPVPVTVAHADEPMDFALLRIPKAKWVSEVDSRGITLRLLTVTQSKIMSELREGETVAYIGYPMRLGIGERNFPVSRVGIISQLVEGRGQFLIDGFVQKGHSGSPVYVLRQDRFTRYLVGIARSYRKDTSDFPGNSGFSYVTAMDAIIDAIKEHFPPTQPDE
ncbi:MAG: serine protease [Bacteroidota bacterium]